MMNLTRFSSPSQRRQRGFSLVELMVALVLGLLVIGGVGGVFLSQRELYRQNENLARMQENARYAFEVMARSLREAGGNLCGASNVANVLKGQSTYWWANWDNAVRGFEGGNTTHDSQFPQPVGTDPAKRVANTDAIIVMSGVLNEGVVITDHNPNSAQFKVNTRQHGLEDGDIVMACDNNDHAAIFQVTNANSSNVTIVHNTGASVSPGNCSKDLSLSTNCNEKTCNGFLAKLAAYAWYIGHNGRGGRSLYRLKLQNDDGKAKDTAEEVAEGVSNLQIQYLIDGRTDYVDADKVDADKNRDDADKDCDGAKKETDWAKVVAVRLEFTLQSLEDVATGREPLQRRWSTVVTLRNRAPHEKTENGTLLSPSLRRNQAP
jgi:type IV pilus assembly protein PilW